MGLYYPTHITRTLIGTKSGTTRTSWGLENTYQTEDGTSEATKTFETGGYPQVVFSFLYTTGAGETNNSVEIKLENSPERTNFYQLMNESASGGTSTLTQREFTFVGASAATAYAFSYRLDTSYEHMRISIKESGVGTNKGTIYCEATFSGK